MRKRWRTPPVKGGVVKIRRQICVEGKENSDEGVRFVTRISMRLRAQHGRNTIIFMLSHTQSDISSIYPINFDYNLLYDRVKPSRAAIEGANADEVQGCGHGPKKMAQHQVLSNSHAQTSLRHGRDQTPLKSDTERRE
jgi:hypothetical protein